MPLQPKEIESPRQDAIDLLVHNNEMTRPEIAYLWKTFLTEITRIPRDSGSEGPMADRLIEWTNEMANATAERDQNNNVLIQLPATAGFEHVPGIIFQGHSDMVCDKEKDAPVDPARDGVLPVISKDGKWIHAIKTTLGADNGNALAIMKTLLHRDKPHGPLAFLVTTSEETGLDGAKALSFNLNGYRYLVNLDGEQLNMATIGCAGGGDTDLTLPVTHETVKDVEVVSVEIEGLLGGHSALKIKEKRGNAIKLVTNIIEELHGKIPLHVVSIEGGSKHNAIPNHAKVDIAVSKESLGEFRELLRQFNAKVQEELPDEHSLSITAGEPIHHDTVQALDEKTVTTMMHLLTALPHGVTAISKTVSGLVETSTNLAILSLDSHGIHIKNLTRSAIDKDRDSLRARIAEIGKTYGADAIQREAYPGWAPDPNSYIISFIRKAYRMMEEILETDATHGGLECGIILYKYPHLEAISIGATLTDPHTTSEALNIRATEVQYYFAEKIIDASLDEPREPVYHGSKT